MRWLRSARIYLPWRSDRRRDLGHRSADCVGGLGQDSAPAKVGRTGLDRQAVHTSDRSYYLSTLGAAWIYPSNLEDLLEDRQFATTRRHLRTIYANPFSGKPDWELVKGVDGRVHGVRAVTHGEGGNTVKAFVYVPFTTS